MAVINFLAPYVWPQVDANGNPYSGAKLYSYLAGTTTPAPTYPTMTSIGAANANPIIFDSKGEPSNGSSIVEVCIPSSAAYKFALYTSADVLVGTWDNVQGINAFTVANIAQWYTNSPVIVPTITSGTTFSIPAANAEFSVGRRIKLTNGGATVFYGTITANDGATPSNITVTNDGAVLSGTGVSVDYGILTSSNPSIPKIALPDGSSAVTQATTVNDTTIATTAYVTTAVSSVTTPAINGFRLSLASAIPVTNTDLTVKTTLYLTPYTGNQIGMYTGSAWTIVTSPEISITFSGTSAGTSLDSLTLPFDIFAVYSGGSITLESLAWQTINTRSAALKSLNGILVKDDGSYTKRYLGTVCPGAAAAPAKNTLDDSVANRGVWNYYNRVNRNLKYTVPQYATAAAIATWRASSVTYRVNFVTGGAGIAASGNAEDTVIFNAGVSCGSATGNSGYTALALNSVTVPSGFTGFSGAAGTVAIPVATVCGFTEIPVMGMNYVQLLDAQPGAQIITFGSTGTFTSHLSAITGTIRG